MQRALLLVSVLHNLVISTNARLPPLRRGSTLASQQSRPLLSRLPAAHMSSRVTLKASRYNRDVPYREAAYNPEAADTFFRQRKPAWLSRLAQLTRLSSSFVFDVVAD